jgi:Spy/CpxP family protein refolding chaperone
VKQLADKPFDEETEMTKRAVRFATAITITLTFLTAGAVLAAPRGAWGQGPGYHGPGAGPLGSVFHELDLTTDQRDRLRSTVEQFMQGQLGELMRAQREQRQTMFRMIHDPNTEESAIVDAVHRSILGAEQLALEQHRMTVALFDILTEEQRQQALELLAELPDSQAVPWRHSRRGPSGGNR